MNTFTPTIQSVKRVSLIFFIITGFLHLGSFAFMINNLYLKQAIIINKTMDVPFIITGLIYGFSALRLSFADPEKDHTVLDLTLLGVTGLVLVGLILVNIIVPNFK